MSLEAEDKTTEEIILDTLKQILKELKVLSILTAQGLDRDWETGANEEWYLHF